MGTIAIYFSEDEETRLNKMKADLFPATMPKKNNVLIKGMMRYCEKNYEDFKKDLKQFLGGDEDE